MQVNIFKFKGVEYIGLQSRKEDYDRDKKSGTNFVEHKIKRGGYDRGKRGKAKRFSASANNDSRRAAPAGTAKPKDQTRSRTAASTDSEDIDDFPKRVLCIRRGFGGQESFRFKLIQRIMDKVDKIHNRVTPMPIFVQHSNMLDHDRSSDRRAVKCACQRLTQATRATKRLNASQTRHATYVHTPALEPGTHTTTHTTRCLSIWS